MFKVRYQVSVENFDISDFEEKEIEELSSILDDETSEIEKITAELGSYWDEFESREDFEKEKEKTNFLSPFELLQEISEYDDKNLCIWLEQNYDKHSGNFHIFCEEMEKIDTLD